MSIMEKNILYMKLHDGEKVLHISITTCF